MSSAGRCIARSTSSGMVVGPGIARNSRPARTTIVVIPSRLAKGKGMPGNGEKFKPEQNDNMVMPAFRQQQAIHFRSFRDGPKDQTPESRDSGFASSTRPGMTGATLRLAPHYRRVSRQ